METPTDLQHKIETEEINPRTGQPYKTSPAARRAKSKWSKKNPEASRSAVYRWIDNNRDRWNEMCRVNQLKQRLENAYLRELFAEALV